jgi:hypothetical protein
MKKLPAILLAMTCMSAVGNVTASDQAQGTNPSPATAGQMQTTSANTKASKLPLDHGPRAQVTPWVNQQRRKQAIKETQATAPASPASSPPSSPH